MRAERRHELETNELADYLGRLLRDYNVHLKLGGIILAAVLIGGLVYRVLATSEARRAARAWEAFMVAREPEDYERIIRDFEGLPAAHWAMLELADLEYSRGLDRLTQNREEAETYLKKALERYRRALQVASEVDSIDPAFGARALLGQAHCYEALGDRSKAIEAYERLLKEYPDTWMARRAEERLEELKKPAAAEFYAALQRAAATAPRTQLPPGAESLLPPAPVQNQPKSSSEAQNGNEAAKEPAEGDASKSASPADSKAPEQADSAKSKAQDTDKEPEKPGEGSSEGGSKKGEKSPSAGKTAPSSPEG